MKNHQIKAIVAVMFLMGFTLSACDIFPDADTEDPQEEMDFSAEEAENDFESGEKESDGEGFNIDPTEAQEASESMCDDLPEYVPCGTFTVIPFGGVMTCNGQSVPIRDVDEDEDFITLTPRDGGAELFALAPEEAEGVLILQEVDYGQINPVATYSGPVVNSWGETLTYTLQYSVFDPTYISGGISGTIDNCIINKAYEGNRVE